jgi:hypothetical protein
VSISSLARVSLNQLSTLPAQSGVYLAVDDASRVWYVGRADSIRDRLAGHEKLDDFRKRKVSGLAWKTVEDKERCKFLEKELIEYFHPPLNLQHNFNNFPASHSGLTPDQEVERFLRLRVQQKLIELELEILKPNIVTRCEQSGGKISHPLGNIRCQEYKSWEYTDEVELLKLKLRKAQEEEKKSGRAKVKSVNLAPVARLNAEALSAEVAVFLSNLGLSEEQEEEEPVEA